MMTGGTGFPNYRTQKPSAMGPDVGRALQQRMMQQQGGMGPMGGPPPGGAPPVGPGGMAGAPDDEMAEGPQGPMEEQGEDPRMQGGQGTVDGFNPASEHSATSTRAALAAAVGRAMGVRIPDNPRYRPAGERQRLKALGIPEEEIQLLEANDPAMRDGT